MQWSQKLQEVWDVLMIILKFAVRLPLVLLLLAITVAGGVVGLLTIYRITEWLLRHFLAAPWT